jgi:four helix bundle protein
VTEENKIHDFTDLVAWQKSHKLVLSIYTVTKTFPTEEKFGLIDQVRRAAVSITSNLAEGFSRKSAKEKIQFFHVSLGSLTELQNQLLIARDVKYITVEECETLFEQARESQKLIRGLLKYLHNS